MRAYHFFMKFMRSFGIGLGIGAAVAVAGMAAGYCVLRMWMGGS